MTPLLFMGQEWSADTPFQYFTDLEPALGRLVTEGRRSEFADFPEFSNEEARGRIPDPQSPSTYSASHLDWAEVSERTHAPVRALYRALLALRLRHAALRASDQPAGDAEAPDEETIVIRRADQDDVFWIVARLKGSGTIDLGPLVEARGERQGEWTLVLSTEEPAYASDPVAPQIDWRPAGPTVHFSRPGAVILRRT
jgi:maltooligosyltrehalose trehalohydrolase